MTGHRYWRGPGGLRPGARHAGRGQLDRGYLADRGADRRDRVAGRAAGLPRPGSGSTSGTGSSRR